MESNYMTNTKAMTGINRLAIGKEYSPYKGKSYVHDTNYHKGVHWNSKANSYFTKQQEIDDSINQSFGAGIAGFIRNSPNKSVFKSLQHPHHNNYGGGINHHGCLSNEMAKRLIITNDYIIPKLIEQNHSCGAGLKKIINKEAIIDNFDFSGKYGGNIHVKKGGAWKILSTINKYLPFKRNNVSKNIPKGDEDEDMPPRSHGSVAADWRAYTERKLKHLKEMGKIALVAGKKDLGMIKDTFLHPKPDTTIKDRFESIKQNSSLVKKFKKLYKQGETRYNTYLFSNPKNESPLIDSASTDFFRYVQAGIAAKQGIKQKIHHIKNQLFNHGDKKKPYVKPKIGETYPTSEEIRKGIIKDNNASVNDSIEDLARKEQRIHLSRKVLHPEYEYDSQAYKDRIDDNNTEREKRIMLRLMKAKQHLVYKYYDEDDPFKIPESEWYKKENSLLPEWSKDIINNFELNHYEKFGNDAVNDDLTNELISNSEQHQNDINETYAEIFGLPKYFMYGIYPHGSEDEKNKSNNNKWIEPEQPYDKTKYHPYNNFDYSNAFNIDDPEYSEIYKKYTYKPNEMQDNNNESMNNNNNYHEINPDRNDSSDEYENNDNDNANNSMEIESNDQNSNIDIDNSNQSNGSMDNNVSQQNNDNIDIDNQPFHEENNIPNLNEMVDNNENHKENDTNVQIDNNNNVPVTEDRFILVDNNQLNSMNLNANDADISQSNQKENDVHDDVPIKKEIEIEKNVPVQKEMEIENNIPVQKEMEIQEDERSIESPIIEKLIPNIDNIIRESNNNSFQSFQPVNNISNEINIKSENMSLLDQNINSQQNSSDNNMTSSESDDNMFSSSSFQTADDMSSSDASMKSLFSESENLNDMEIETQPNITESQINSNIQNNINYSINNNVPNYNDNTFKIDITTNEFNTSDINIPKINEQSNNIIASQNFINNSLLPENSNQQNDYNVQLTSNNNLNKDSDNSDSVADIETDDNNKIFNIYPSSSDEESDLHYDDMHNLVLDTEDKQRGYYNYMVNKLNSFQGTSYKTLPENANINYPLLKTYMSELQTNYNQHLSDIKNLKKYKHHLTDQNEIQDTNVYIDDIKTMITNLADDFIDTFQNFDDSNSNNQSQSTVSSNNNSMMQNNVKLEEPANLANEINLPLNKNGDTINSVEELLQNDFQTFFNEMESIHNQTFNNMEANTASIQNPLNSQNHINDSFETNMINNSVSPDTNQPIPIERQETNLSSDSSEIDTFMGKLEKTIGKKSKPKNTKFAEEMMNNLDESFKKYNENTLLNHKILVHH
ncbi:hypothetical protein WA158_005824 [Blastocystis sp. Blastoise]